MNPAQAAKRLLLGTGLGLSMAVGLGFISGQIKVDNPINAWSLIILLAMVCLALAGPTGRGKGPLSSMFPNEDRHAMVSRVESDLSETRKDADMGDAWARLEESMLSKEIEEE